jgi:hypothetical protein
MGIMGIMERLGVRGLFKSVFYFQKFFAKKQKTKIKR